MTQRDRDRLVVLKKAQKYLITRRQAAEELGITERHVRRLLVRLHEVGDGGLIHGLRGRTSNRKLSEDTRSKAVAVLSQEVYRGFGPTLASEYLASKHKLRIGREALRQLMLETGLWRGRRQKIETIHEWRPRRSSRGEMVQWDTSEHDWLEGRGEKLYLIHMIDDATSELTARFVRHDSTEENMRLLWSYVERNGRPLSFYTDKAAMFQTPPRLPRKSKLPRDEREPLPPTQLGRGLRELGITWIAAHSPQAKGRIERSFRTAQDRLVKGLRVAGVKTLEQANAYLELDFVPWWNQHLVVVPANPTDAHRPLGPEHDLAACLSLVETRQVANDYTLRFRHDLYQIARPHVRPGLRGANVRVEARLDGSIAVRFEQHYLLVTPCVPALKAAPEWTPPVKPKRGCPSEAYRRSQQQLLQGRKVPLWQAAKIDRTRTVQSLD
jgi:Homeodomain-like domain